MKPTTRKLIAVFRARRERISRDFHSELAAWHRDIRRVYDRQLVVSHFLSRA